MVKWIRPAAVLGAIALAFAAFGATPAPADSPSSSDSPSSKVYGMIDRLPDTPDAVGEWSVGGRTVTVDAQTRLERHGSGRHDAGTFGVGRFVEAKVRPGEGGRLHAIEIELEDDDAR